MRLWNLFFSFLSRFQVIPPLVENCTRTLLGPLDTWPPQPNLYTNCTYWALVRSMSIDLSIRVPSCKIFTEFVHQNELPGVFQDFPESNGQFSRNLWLIKIQPNGGKPHWNEILEIFEMSFREILFFQDFHALKSKTHLQGFPESVPTTCLY